MVTTEHDNNPGDIDERELDAVEQWCEDTGNELAGEEADEARRISGEITDETARGHALAAASELWLRDPHLHPSLRLPELDHLTLVVTAVLSGEITSRDKPDGGDFVRDLVQLFTSERDAAERALELVRRHLGNNGQDHILESCPSTVDKLDEVRQWCNTVAPGYGWFWVDGVGWVLHRLGSE